MSIPLFLAFTAEEFSQKVPFPAKTAWMSVHFSPNGSGLTNLPPQLPQGSLILLDDHIQWANHSIERVCQELVTVLQRTESIGLLLDFEREPTAETLLLTKALGRCCKELGVALSAPPKYLLEDDTTLFLSPFPCSIAPENIDPQRKVWLDISPVCHSIRISKDCTIGSPAPYTRAGIPNSQEVYWDEDLLCNYYSEADGDDIRITLFRDATSAAKLLNRLNPAKIQLAIGLWRDFGASLD